MGIDRSRVKTLKNQSDIAKRVVQNGADLLQLCRKCRTAEELAELWPRFKKHVNVAGPDEYTRLGQQLLVKAGKKRVIALRINVAIIAARRLPPGTMLDDEFWRKHDLLS